MSGDVSLPVCKRCELGYWDVYEKHDCPKRNEATYAELLDTLKDVDFRLARMEDEAHGEWGKDITSLRIAIQNTLYRI